MPAGGYMKPTSPAPASGPGQLARRTDGGPSQPVRSLNDAEYGEQAEYRSLQQGAALGSSAPTPRIPSGAASSAQGGSPLVGFGEPTLRPDEDILTPPPAPQPEAQRDAAQLAALLPMLTLLAAKPDASPSTKAFVSRLRGLSP